MRSAVIFCTVILLLLTIGGNPAQARIRHVPNDFESIQDGINAAQDGDTVLVQPGTYVENIFIIAKNITVGSLFLTTGDDTFIERTIIDGDEIGTVVNIRSNVTSEGVLCGFTITNGRSNYGGGIYINASEPTLDHLLVVDNMAVRHGGGLYSTQESDPTIVNLTVANNLSQLGNGGISTFNNSNASITNSIFWGNDRVGMPDNMPVTYCDIQGGYGGEGNINQDPAWVDSDRGDFHITENSPCIDTGDPNSPEDRDGSRADIGAFIFNQGNVRVFNVPDEYDTIQEAIDATEDGDTVLVQPGEYGENIDFTGKEITVGSLYLITDDEDYIHNTIIDGGRNGSVVTFNSSETENSILTGFTIRNGQAENGGGVLISRSNPTLDGLEIEANRASVGGGIYVLESDCTIKFVSVIGNNSNRDGSGISCHNSVPIIFNCTISANTTNREGGGFYGDENCQILPKSCIFWNNEPAQIAGDGELRVTYSDIQNEYEGQGNIDADPLFADPDSSDFHLTWENWRDEDETKSPCIDTGDPDRIPDPEATRADMGAYYWHQEPYRAIIVVDPQTLDAQINTGNRDTLNYNVANEGDTLLIYETEVDITLEPEGAPRRDRRGGPDEIEYEWRDDDEDDGPGYGWIDVSHREDAVEVPMGNDVNRGPYDLGFEFNYYDNTYTSVRMCSNGWASFTSSRTYYSYSNWGELPANRAPDNFLGVAMSDWNPSSGGDYYFWTDEEMAVLTWENVPHWSGLGSWTFQIILYATGMIKYQYAETGSPDGRQLVGLQDLDKEYGFEILRDEDDYLVPERAIAISRIWEEWIRVEPLTGEIAVEANRDFDVILNAEDLVEGNYAADIHILTNDPENLDVVVTVSLEVLGLPVINVTWNNELGYPDNVNWNSAYNNVLVGYDYDIDLDIHNEGTADLNIDSVRVDNEAFYVEGDQFTVNANDIGEMTVTFSTDREGEHRGNMTIYCNDPENDEYEIALIASAEVLQPEIEVIWSEQAGYPDLIDWNRVYEEVFTGVRYEVPITIQNTGRRDLEIIEITSGNEYLSAGEDNFVIEPDNEREVTLYFNADEAGEINTVITIRNNTEVNPQYTIAVHANALNPPIISFEPDEIIDSLYVDWVNEIPVELSNDGEATLRFTIEDDIINEPERDQNDRSLRGVGKIYSPRRDELGDEIAQYQWDSAPTNRFKHSAYDAVNEVMWLTTYNPNSIAAVRFDEDYQEFEEVIEFQPAGNPMDCASLNGIIYAIPWANNFLLRYDIEGNNIGNLNLPNRPIAVTASPENNWLMYISDLNWDVMRVFEFNEEGGIEQIASSSWRTGGFANSTSRCISWVDAHRDGQLWVGTSSHIWEVYIDTDAWEVGEIIQDMNFGGQYDWDGPGGHDGHNLWVSSHNRDNFTIIDDGRIERNWISYEPTEGEINGGENTEITIILDAIRRTVGFYEADVIFRSNDPFNHAAILNVRLYISEPPSLVVEWDDEYGFPNEVNWNQVYPDVYNNHSYDIEVYLSNYDDQDIDVSSIEFQGDGAEYFSVDDDQFTIQPDDEVTRTITLQADQSGDHEVTMIINSNAEEREEYGVLLVATTSGPPEMTIQPDQLSDDLITGEAAEHNLAINNVGESRLLVTLETEMYSEPNRDENARTLRGPNRTRRDPGDPGDLLGSFNDNINAGNQYCNVSGWDPEHERMWVTNYNARVAAAYTHDANYENFEETIRINMNNIMDGCFVNGLFWVHASLGNSSVNRYDEDGEMVGAVQFGHNVYGMAADADEQLLFVQESGNNYAIHVYPIDEENRPGDQLGVINNHQAYHGNQAVYGLEWVGAHEFPLWMEGGRNNTLYQIAVDRDEWTCVDSDETVQFDIGNNGQMYFAVGHDGENMWAGGWAAADIRIYDDGVAEKNWLQVEPTEAEIAVDSSTDFTVTLDAFGLSGGEYTGAVLITSNDPNNNSVEFPVTMNVDDAPDISVQWSADYGYPDEIDWNRAFDGIYKDLQYEIIVTVTSTGVTQLQVSEIQIDNGDISPNVNRFDLEPNARQDVEILFQPSAAGEVNTTLTFSSNSEAHPEVEIPMTAVVENAPEIVVNPNAVEESIMLGNIVESTITVENQGDALLRFDTEIDLTGDPERDADSRSLRNADIQNSPHRDNAGDEIAQITIPGGNHGANTYKSGIAYNSEDELMYLTNYSRRRIDAVSFDDDYENIELDHGWVPNGNEMGAGWLDGVLYTVPWASAGLNRYDAEGNSFGMINMPTRPTACTTSPENDWVMIIGDQAGYDLLVYTIDGDNVHQEGRVDWSVDGVPAQSRSCCWMDIHPDQQLWINTPNHLYNLAIDTDNWTPERVQDFAINNSNDWWSGVGHDGHNLWLGPYRSADYFVIDDGVTELYWILLEPTEGEVSSGENNTMELTLTLTTTDLVIGDYTADIYFLSNDPATPETIVDITMHVLEAPDIDVTWEHFDAENPDLIDWGDYHEEVFAGYEYEVPITVSNVGDDTLSVERISVEGEDFRVNPDQFEVEPDNNQEVVITFDAPEPGEFQDVLTIVSDDPDEDTLTFNLQVTVLAVPRIDVDTEEIVDELEAGSETEHTVNIGNIGAENLRWWSEIEIQNEPGRDPDARSLRRIGRGIPRRDELGELIDSFTWNHSGDNRHKAGITWDRENEWMWLTCYNTDYLGAVDPNNNYEEVIAWEIDPQHPMGAAWLNGVIHVLNWGRDWLGRWDADGNNLGNLNTPVRATALTSSSEYLMMITDDVNRNILILNEDGNQVDLIDNYRQYIEGNSRSIQWVNLHPDGELWLNTEGHVWQVNIDSDWEATGLVSDFEWEGSQEWDGIGHDGENLWLGPWNQSEYYIVDDEIEESRWLTVIPARGIIAPDNNQDLTVYLDARVDYAGDYGANLHFTSNDPVDPDVVVSVQLTITGETDIVVEPQMLDFQEIEHGTSEEMEFTILNDGYSDLTVSDIAPAGEFFSIVDPPEGDIVINPHTNYTVTVEFAPNENELGFFEGTVTITSNDPDEETVEVALQGTSIYIEYPPEVVNPIDDLDLDEDFDPFVVADLDTVFSDANHDELEFSAESADENLIVEIVDGSLLQLDSEDDWFGDAVVTVIGDDGNEARDETSGRSLRSSSQAETPALPRRDPATPTEFNVHVNSVNDAPEVVSPIPDKEFNEDSGEWVIADLDTVFTDVDGDDLEFSVNGDEDLTLTLDEENLLTISVEDNYYGANLHVTATADDGQESTNDEFLVTIFNVNDTPEVVQNIDDVEFEEDSGPWEIVDLDDVFFDIDGDELSYDVNAEDPLEWSIDGENIFTLDAPEDFNGDNLEVTVTADDNQGERIPMRFSANMTGSADNSANDASRDTGPVRNLRNVAFDKNSGVAKLASQQQSTSRLVHSDFSNPHRDASAEDVFIVTITPINDPPVWDDTPQFFRSDENELVEFTVSGSDVDGDELDIDFASDNLPESAGFTDHNDGTGSFSWQTNFDDSGEYNCIFTLSDAEYNVETEIRFRIDHVNRRPVYSEQTPRTAEVNENELLTIVVSGTDPDGDDLDITYTRIDIPREADASFDFDGENTGTFRWQTTFEDEGEYTARFTLSDEEFDIIRNVTITVVNVNRRPEWENEPIDQAVHEGETIEFTITASDPDGDEIDIAYASDDLPDEVEFNFDGESEASFTWETDFDSEGNYSASFTVSDGDLTLETGIALAVGNVNRRPQWDELPETITVSEGELIEFHVAGSDPDEEDLTISDNIPEGAEFVDQGDGSGDFTWQTYHDDEGEYVVTLTLSDGDLDRIAEISVTVEQDNVLNVPDEYEAIQDAIDKSADGDTVLVEPGEYVENIDFIGKDIVVMGNPNDPSETVIDGDENGSVVTFENEESEDAILTGFALTGGSAGQGGGIYCEDSSPNISSCIIVDNFGGSWGGGICIRGNTNLQITDSRILSNSAGFTGGGVFAGRGASAVLIGCTFNNNIAEGMENPSGSAIFAGESVISLTNCTISSEPIERRDRYNAICLTGSHADIVNSIIWSDWGTSIILWNEYGENQITIAYTDIEGGEDAIYSSDNDEVNWSEGNIDSDPLFADPDNGDFSLTWANYPEYDETRSPCINTGDPDSDNDPDDTRADMGAYYFDHEPDNDIAVAPPDSINFGEVSVADASDEALTISNVGELTLTVNDIDIDGEGFSVDFEGSVELESGGETTFTVTFAPEEVGNFEGELTIASDDPNESDYIIQLTGIGINDAPEIVAPIDDVELNEDFDPFVVANLSEVFSDPNGDELSFYVESSVEQFNVELINGSQLQISAVEHWFGDAVITIIADDGIGARDQGPVRNLRSTGVAKLASHEQGTSKLVRSGLGNNPRRDDETEEQFNVHVNAINDPPQWTDVPEDTTIAESALIEFDVMGEDVDDEELTITNDIPEGAEFTDNGDGTGHFRWQTDYNDAGDHTLMFILSDEEYDVETVINVTVTNVNRTPDWTQEPVDQEVDENELLEFTITAEDPDGDEIDITHRFADLPQAAEFVFDGENTGTFSWQTTYDDEGEYSAEFTVSDGDLETVTEITITVLHVNRSPVWIDEPVDQQVREGETLSFEISGEDPDGDELDITYSSDDLPETVVYNFDGDDNTGSFTWNVSYDDAGDYSALFVLTDGNLGLEVTIDITVTDVNRAPDWTSFQENVEVAENELLELTVSGEDPDGDAVTIDFASDELPEGWDISDDGNGNGTLSWQTGYDDEGVYHGAFSIADEEFTIESGVTITVSNVNRSPVWTDIAETYEIDEDELLEFTVSGEDPDDNDLTITLNLEDLPEAINFNDNENGTGDFSWQPGFNDAGVYEAIFAISDGDLTAESTIEITVLHVNRAPTWISAPENQAVNESEEVRFTISAEDPDGDEIEITWASDNLPDDAEFNFDGEDSGTFVWQTNFEDEGNFTASFTVSDAEFDVTTEITISVGDVNRPPDWINPPELVELDEADVLDIVIEGDDPDGDDMTIEYTSDNLPDGFEFNDNGDGTASLYWETGYEDAGEYSANFTLSDGEFDADHEITITVTDVNRTPEVIEEIDNLTIDEDPDPNRVDIANLDNVFNDPDGDNLRFSFNGSTEEMHMDIDNDNMLYFIPDQNYNLPGGVEITVTADDARDDGERDVGPVRILRYSSELGGTDIPVRRDAAVQEQFILTINAVNDDPVWDDYPESAEASETEVIEFNISGSDVDGDNLEITMTSENLPEAARLQDNGDGSARFYWETGYDDAGNYTAAITLSDGDLTDEFEVSITVNNLNRAPYWTDVPDYVEVNENEEMSFTISGEDSDDDQLTLDFSSDNLPEEFQFTDNNNGTADISWQTDYESAGMYSVTFIISDGDLSEETEVTLRVRGVNRNPIFTDIPERIDVDETAAIEFRVACEDPDRDNINITFSSDDLPEAAEFRFDEQTAGHFNWQTTYDDAGEYTAHFVVSDGILTDEADVVISVTNVNRAPVWVDAEDYVEFWEDQSIEYNISAEDPDGERISIVMDSDDLPDETEFTDNGDGSGVLTWDIGYEDDGEYHAVFTVSDGVLSDEIDVTFVVYDVNRAPDVIRSIGDIRIDEDPDPGTIIIADLDETFSDPDGDEMTFSYSEAPDELNMVLDEDNVLSFSPDENYNLPQGIEVIVRADDNREQDRAGNRDIGPVRSLRGVGSLKPERDRSTPEIFTITVNAVRDEPEWVEIPEEINAVVNENIYFVVNAVDVDGDELDISAVVPEGSEFNDNGDGSGVFSWQTTPDDEGDYTIEFELTDGDFVIETEVPVHVVGVRNLVIDLDQNWKMISINITLDEEFYDDDERGPDVVLMLEQLRIDADNHQVERIKDENGDFYVPSWGFNNIAFWNYEEGYQIKMTEQAELSWTGVPIPASTDISIEEGWNIVSYFPEYELTASFNNGENDFYVIASIIDNVIIAKDGAGDFIWPLFNFSNMEPWRPGQGYQINVDEEVTLNYPEPLDREASIPGSNDDNLRLFPRRTDVNMSILINSINGMKLDKESRIVAFNSSGRPVGSGFINDNVCGLAVWGDDVSTDERDGLLEGETFEIRLINDAFREQYRLDHQVLEGDGLIYKTDEFTALNVTVGGQYVNDYKLSPASPNPFNAVTKLDYQLPVASSVSISVFDLNGRLVATLFAGEKQAGKYDVIWDGKNAVSGIYLVRMRTDNFSKIRKVTLIK